MSKIKVIFMKSSFYKYFNCNNKEELYLKLKKNSIDTHKLGKYLKFNQEKENKKIIIKGQYKLFDYLKNNIPDRDEVQVIMFNDNLEVLSDYKFPIKTEFKDILDKSYVETGNRVILLSHESEYNKLLKLEMDFELFGYGIIDRIELDKNLVIDSKNGMENYQFTEEDIINGKNKNFKEETKKINFKELHEFMDYYAKNELLNLNIKDDRRKIKQILKIANQEKSQEYFGIIEYNKDQNITNIETSLFKGGIRSAKVDPILIAPFLLNKDTDGLIIFHNHPAGSVSPSKEDLSLTDYIEKMANRFYKNIEDHFIIGKNNIFSFREEFLLSNYSYERSSNKEVSISEKVNKLIQPIKTKSKEISTRSRVRSKGQER